MGRLKNKKTLPVFNKPSTELNSNHGRVWKNVPVQDLQEGDIVAGKGVVLSVASTENEQIALETGYPEPKREVFDLWTTFHAFVKE